MKANRPRWNTDERLRYMHIKIDCGERGAAADMPLMTRLNSDKMKG